MTDKCAVVTNINNNDCDDDVNTNIQTESIDKNVNNNSNFNDNVNTNITDNNVNKGNDNSEFNELGNDNGEELLLKLFNELKKYHNPKTSKRILKTIKVAIKLEEAMIEGQGKEDLMPSLSSAKEPANKKIEKQKIY